MKISVISLFIALFSAGMFAEVQDWAEPKTLAVPEEAYASDFGGGFNAVDATDCLEAAFNSGVPRLIVDKQQGPWIINKTLNLVSNQEIVFEEGAEILAKKECFAGKNDSLMLLSSVSNVTLRGMGAGATLRMQRDDYAAAPYIKAEWRHVLTLRGCKNINIYNLTLAESGGDGIYLGTIAGVPPNKDIHIKDVICDKNYRQGISVISAENLLIEDTIMRDTAGTPPSAGIDFEPNNSKEFLKNIVMRGCLTSNNVGDGYEIYLPNLNQKSEPVSIQIENCRSVGDHRKAVRLITGNASEAAVRGTIVFSDCEFKDAIEGGIEIASKPDYGVQLAFDRCIIDGCAAGQSNRTDITLANTRTGDVTPVGGIRFEQLSVLQPLPRPWIGWLNNYFHDETLTNLTGDVVVTCGGQTQHIFLTPEWVRIQFPPRFEVRVPRMIVDWQQLRVKDGLDGLQPLEPMRVRGQGSYIFYATTTKEVVLTGTQLKVGSYAISSNPLLIKALSGATLKQITMPAVFGEEAEIKFNASQTGFYRLEVATGQNSFRLEKANVPIALDVTSRPINLIASKGTLCVDVAPEIKLFAFAVSGASGECVKASVIDPFGSTLWMRESISELDRFTSSGSTQLSGLWRIKLERPVVGHFEDYSVDVLGVPGFLFLNPQRTWYRLPRNFLFTIQ